MEAKMHLLPPMVELDLILLILPVATLTIAWLTGSLPRHRAAPGRRSRQGHPSDH
jgi:hypothetical protein